MVNRGDSYENLPYYTSFDLAWLAPITYPLALSLVSISFALWENHRAGFLRTSTNALSTASVVVEAFFAIACFVQCVLNASRREYVGGEDACDVQAWYATFWAFASCPMQALVAWASFRILTLTGADDAGATGQAGGSDRAPLLRKGHVVAGAGCIIIGALVVSLLPVMGVGYYAFPKDFCMFELHDPVMGGLFLAMFGVALLVTCGCHLGAVRALLHRSKEEDRGRCIDKEQTSEQALEKPPKNTALNTMPTFYGALTPIRLQILMVAWFVVVWGPTAIVVLLYQVEARVPPVTSFVSALVAISLHSNQLFNPLLVGIVWRRWAAEVVTLQPSRKDGASASSTKQEESVLDDEPEYSC